MPRPSQSLQCNPWDALQAQQTQIFAGSGSPRTSTRSTSGTATDIPTLPTRLRLRSAVQLETAPSVRRRPRALHHSTHCLRAAFFARHPARSLCRRSLRCGDKRARLGRAAHTAHVRSSTVLIIPTPTGICCREVSGSDLDRALMQDLESSARGEPGGNPDRRDGNDDISTPGVS